MCSIRSFALVFLQGRVRTAAALRRPNNGRAQQLVMTGVMQDQAAGVARRARYDLRLTAASLLIFTLPQLVATVFVLMSAGSTDCDSALGMWVTVNSVRLVLVFAIYWVLAVFQNTPTTQLPLVARIAHGLYQPVMLISWVWLVVGTLWVINTATCPAEAPELYKLTLAMVILAFLWLFMPLVLLILLVPFAVCCFPVYIRILRGLQVIEAPRPSAGGATRQDLGRVPRVTFSAAKRAAGDIPDDACPICLADFTEGQSVRQPPCGHVVCKDCGDTWWRINATCPVCRQPIVGGDGADKPPGEGEDATAGEAVQDGGRAVPRAAAAVAVSPATAADRGESEGSGSLRADGAASAPGSRPSSGGRSRPEAISVTVLSAPPTPSHAASVPAGAGPGWPERSRSPSPHTAGAGSPGYGGRLRPDRSLQWASIHTHGATQPPEHPAREVALAAGRFASGTPTRGSRRAGGPAAGSAFAPQPAASLQASRQPVWSELAVPTPPRGVSRGISSPHGGVPGQTIGMDSAL